MYRFEAPLWRWDGDGGWHFVTVPDDVSEDIAVRTAGTRRGFGSVRVRATIGVSSWSTSLFPDSTRGGGFVLPVKKQVRVAEGVDEGDSTSVSLELVDD